MWTPRGAWPLTVAAVVGALLVVVPVAGAADLAKPSKPAAKKAKATPVRPPVPGGLLPASGVTLDRMPVFTWSSVKQADHYEFQVAADKGFNSTISGNDGKQLTRNTAATVAASLANGSYWWRVRSVTAKHKTSDWTKGRSVALAWAPLVNVTGPADGTVFTTPASDPTAAVTLRWAAMPGAAQYSVSLASDPLLGTQWTADGKPQITQGTSYVPNGTFADGTYYWSVTPIDPAGHAGIPSAIRSFVVHWDAVVPAPTMTDVVSADSLMAPRFTWGRVPGAASYEVEISTSSQFAGGSKVCCSGVTTGTSYGPPSLLQDNDYYWRVRAFDGSGFAGPWTVGPQFTKSFDSAGVKNLELRDMSDIGEVNHSLTNVPDVNTPVVTWDPVIGASAYEVEVDLWTGTDCDPDQSVGTFTTAVPAWTPLGALGGVAPSIGNAPSVATDDLLLDPGESYCVQVRAIDTDTSDAVVGPWTAIDSFTQPAFHYGGATSSPHAQCNIPMSSTNGYLCAADYLSPVNSVSFTETPPVFVWKPAVGAGGYYVIVAKDPNFHNILDYAYTNVPAYAPRFGTSPFAYGDESPGTPLYWAVLPTAGDDGSGYAPAAGLVSLGAPQLFNKQSLPPTITATGVDSNGFALLWAPLTGAAYYTVQVATDAGFANVIDSLVTDSPSFTASTSYPAAQTYFYRVRANDLYDNGLNWAVGSFSMPLSAPVPSAPSGEINAPALDGAPIWSWALVPGAVSYDVHTDYPSGSSDDSNTRSIVSGFSKLNGTGVWNWRVRGEFPKSDGGLIPGPWSATQSFTRTFGEPVGERVVATRTRLIFSWEPKQGAKQYHLQVASDPDFTTIVEDVNQDGVRYAPALTSDAYLKGGRLYWHVQAIDPDANQGDWSTTSNVLLARGLKLNVGAAPKKGQSRMIRIKVTTVSGAPVKDVTVRVVGAGTVQRAKKTSKKGLVSLRVHPTARGVLTFRATKAGYQLAAVTQKVA